MEDEERSGTARGRKRTEIGDDGLSKLWRERIDAESDHPPPMMETIAELVTRYRAHLMEKGWPDPLLRHVWVENCPTGEVFDEELDRAIATGRIRVR